MSQGSRRDRMLLLSALALLASCVTTPERLHQRLLTLDTHLDTPALFGVQGWDFAARHAVGEDGSQVDLPRMVEGGLDGGFFATYIPQGPLTDAGRAAARSAAHARLDEIHAVVERYGDRMEIALTAADARRIAAAGKRIVFLSMENGYPVGTRPELLAEFHARGVRMASPVHFRHNDLATSSTDIRRMDAPGLTAAGREWVRQANRLGILIDASHASDATLDEILALSTRPIVLSHSGAKAVFRHPRNVDDEQLRRIAARDGVIQVAAYPDYLVERPPNPERDAEINRVRQQLVGERTLTMRRELTRQLREIERRWPVPPATYEQFIAHLLHVIRVAGARHAGIGIDFDGGGGVAGLEDATAYPRITASLRQAGLSDRDIAAVWGGNVLRILAAAQDVGDAGIAGVVNRGTAIELVKEGFDGTEGPLPQADGGLLFTENRAGRIIRIAPDGSTSVWMEPAGVANALTRTPRGELVAALTATPAIAVLAPGQAPRVLVSDYQGTPFNRPNDLVAGRLGQIYFTDPAAAAAPGVAPKVSAVYQITPGGELLRIAADIERPNGIALSPDERRLYVANTAGPWVVAFDVDRKGVVGKRSNFARLELPSGEAAAQASGADGLAVDSAGRVYVATTRGVQVFSPRGAALGIIVLPKAPQNLAFAGPDRSLLYVLGRGSVYRIATSANGPRRPGK